MEQIIRAGLVVLLWAAVAAAGSNNLSLAKQWEARGNYAKASEEYSMAASQTDNLNRKAELMYEVGRCRIKAGDASFIGALIADIKNYAADRGKTLVPKLLAQLEEFAWKSGDEEARQALSVVISENEGRRKALSEKANAKNRKALAYWLDPSLNEADCRAKRAQALNATSTALVAEKLSASRDICPTAPSEKEHKAFSARANAETDSSLALSLYQQIKATWGYLDHTSINHLVVYGRQIRVYEGNEKTVENIRLLLPEDVVEDKLDRVAALGYGNWEVSLNYGERSPYLLTTSVAGEVGFLADHKYFELVTENGERYKVYEPQDEEKISRLSGSFRFYLKCLDNGKKDKCGITMTVK